MDIFADFQARVAAALAERIAAGAPPLGVDLGRFLVEPARETAHGDLVTNAAMIYAKEARALGFHPRALAEALAEKLRQGEDVAAADVAGPGFLNIRLKPRVYADVLRAILTQGDAYGRGSAQGGGAVNVGWVGACPMRLAQARGAVFADALANLLAFSGHRVVREYRVDGARAGVDSPVCDDELAALGVTRETSVSERPPALGAGAAAPPPAKGLACERGLQLADFASPEGGGEGGGPDFASDLGYYKRKIEGGFSRLIDVWDAERGRYVKPLQAAVRALSNGRVALDVRLCQGVRLTRASEPTKNKHAPSLREVVDEVGVDPVRFLMLMRRSEAPLDFDLVEAADQSAGNPVFWVQYAHARACGVARQARAAFADVGLSGAALAKADLAPLADEGERALLRKLAEFPRVVAQGAEAREPHRLAFFAHELATQFHSYWTRGRDQPHLRFVNEKDRVLTEARLALAAGVRQVLKSALALLGVGAPEEMR